MHFYFSLYHFTELYEIQDQFLQTKIFLSVFTKAHPQRSADESGVEARKMDPVIPTYLLQL